MSINFKQFGEFIVVKDPIALDARYAVVRRNESVSDKDFLIAEMTQIRGDNYMDNGGDLVGNANFIASCFNLQQKYDIGLFEETISSLQEVLDYWDSGNFTRKKDMWDRMRSILTKVKQNK